MFVPISPADTAPVTIIPSRVATLPTIVTKDSALFRSPRLQGFAERIRTAHAGYFIGPDQLRDEGGRPLGEVLIHRVPGVIITPGQHSGYMLQRSAHCARGSAPDVYLDGVPVAHPAPGAPIDLSDFQTEKLAGIEYYATPRSTRRSSAATAGTPRSDPGSACPPRAAAGGSRSPRRCRARIRRPVPDDRSRCTAAHPSPGDSRCGSRARSR